MIFRSRPKKAPTIFSHNLSRPCRILMIFIPFESPEFPLTNGINIIKIRHDLLKLWAKIVGAFLGRDRKIIENPQNIRLKKRIKINVIRI